MTPSYKLLERLAAALGIPVTAFYENGDEPENELLQAADLIEAFFRIKDPLARRYCLDFVRDLAGRTSIGEVEK